MYNIKIEGEIKMYLLITFIGVTLALFIIGFLVDKFSSWYDGDIFKFLGWIALVITIISVILVPIRRYYSTGRVIEYKTRQEVIQQQRNANVSELERVELTKEILSDNVWLKDCQYDINSKWISIYYDKEILELQPIK